MSVVTPADFVAGVDVPSANSRATQERESGSSDGKQEREPVVYGAPEKIRKAKLSNNQEIEWSSDDEVEVEVPTEEAPWKRKYVNARRGDNELHPLFMEASDMPDNPFDDPDLAALADIMEEGTPAERAENLKHEGNNHFREGKKMKRGYYNAITAYTAALDAGSPDPVANAVYLVNRAAANLALKNNGRVIADCKEALKLDPKNTKAYYRGAVAANDLRRSKVALKFARGGLKVDPTNSLLKKQITVAEKRIEAERIAAERQNAETARKRTELQAHTAKLMPEFLKRGIKIGMPQFSTQAEYPVQVRIAEEDGLLHWPVMFLYEEHRQSDFIQDVAETDALGDHLEYMFPPSGEAPAWDKEGKYVFGSIELYVELGITEPLPLFKKPKNPKPRLLRLQLTTPIAKLLSHPDYVIPHFPAVHVVVKPSKFRDAFLQRYEL
jgi:tetratricopeptide repeat protein 4